MSLSDQHRPSIRQLKRSVGLAVCAAGFTAVVLVVTQAGDAYADFNRRVYVGAGAGVTQLNPETPNASLKVSEKTDVGFHIVAGYDFTSRLSAEVYYADLGAAEIAFLGSDVGGINYKVYGLSGIGYLFNSRTGFAANPSTSGMGTREGLSLYTRVGIGGVSADSELDYNVDHATHLALGLGAEYGFKNGFAVRGELKAFDTDQQYASVSLLKRFGKASSNAPIAAPMAAVMAAVEPEADTPTVRSKPTFPTFAPMYFEFDQSVISADAAKALDEMVAVIGDSDVNIVLEGHTDWVASESYNLALSLRRAESVRRYLQSKGINRTSMTTVGFGEVRPIASNATAEGRAKNRRVDIRLK